MRAALYARQSIDADEGITRQLERCRQLVSARGWEPGPEYPDNDTSASKARGAGTAWARMLDDADAFDVVVAVNLDRLLRTQRDLITLLDAGIKITTLEGELDLASASGEMQASVLTAMARFEARRKSERQVRANDHRATHGKVVRGRRPFGYEADGITVQPEEAEAVRSGFQAFAAGGALLEVARDWNERGLVTGQGGTWRHDNVRAVLLNPRYIGQVRRHGEIVSETAEWAPLVDVDTFRRVTAILRDPSRRTSSTNAARLLSGIALCSICGSKMVAGGAARRGIPAYRCGGSTGHIARKAEPVDEFVTEIVCSFLQATKVGDLVAQGPEGEALAAEADELRTRLDSLAIEFADGALTASQLRVASERLRERLSALERRMLDSLRAREVGDLVGRADVRSAWEALSLSRRRRVLRALPLEVVVHPPGRGTRTFRPESVEVRSVGH